MLKSLICFDYNVKIEKIILSSFIRIGSYMKVRLNELVMCRKRCVLKSEYFTAMPDVRKEDLCAKIYYNVNNINEYMIEVYNKEM